MAQGWPLDDFVSFKLRLLSIAQKINQLPSLPWRLPARSPALRDGGRREGGGEGDRTKSTPPNPPPSRGRIIFGNFHGSRLSNPS
jgi:hypothetical protein